MEGCYYFCSNIIACNALYFNFRNHILKYTIEFSASDLNINNLIVTNILFLTDPTKSANEYKLRTLFMDNIILCLSSCFYAWVSNFLCFLEVREHIKSFPRQTSHYSRQDRPLRRYLSEDLSAQRMHHMYLKLHERQQLWEKNQEILMYLTTPEGFRVGFSRFFFAWI